MAKFYDTLLGEYIKNPGARGLSLDKIAQRDFGYDMIHYDEIIKESSQLQNKKNINFKDVDILNASIYSGEDVYITAQIYKKQNQEKVTENTILQDIEIPLINVLKDIEISGVKIDRDKLKGIGLMLENEVSTLEKEIFHDVGEEFNINSPKQVGEILFDKLSLPRGKKTKTGYSVGAEVLGDLAQEFPIAQKIVDYRHYTKLLSTYIDGLLDICDENDFVHTSYNSAVTTTGRLSSTKPNLQNIPSSDGIAGEIRNAFVSRFDNGIIIAADYSQIEVRLLAIMAKDKNLLNAFKDGVDIHHKTAEFLFPGTVITGNERKIAKAVNFGVIYGISAFGLSKMINISMKDAKVYIDAFYDNYSGVKIFLDQIIEGCKINGYVETMFGRKRYIPGINDSNAMIQNAAKREAINMPIQGSNADIIKIAMIKIFHFLKENKLKSQMIMQVHDELVFDVVPEEKDIMLVEIKKIMENIVPNLPITLKVDVEYGKTWKEAK